MQRTRTLKSFAPLCIGALEGALGYGSPASMVNGDDPKSDATSTPPTPDPAQEGARDFLAEAASSAELRPEVADIVSAWLEGQLRADQYARLEQAGHSVEDKIPLARVFVDLEVSQSPVPEPRAGGAGVEGFVKGMLEGDPVRLAFGGKGATHAHAPESALGRVNRGIGYVVVGGPGQGKSTVGQFLCQLHRAALLAPRSASLAPEGRQALEALLTQCAGSPLAPPASPSIPVRVVLGDFAAWVTSSGAPSSMALFRYLSERIRHSTGRDVTPEELGQLLIAHPCLLVFDGLDEVPVTSGRHEMLVAVRDGIRHLANGGAMGLVVATTRPQGYAGELTELHLSPLHLSPLSRDRALDYARRLASVRFGDRPDRQERVLERLTQASKEEATARLMRSPLQVTIMATLVDRIGRAPQERWSLFQDYYRVVYEREMERSIPAADLLRRHRGHIDRIHAKVGLLLHVESERSGGTEALMTRDRLEQVVEETLLEDEFDKPQRAALTEIILGAALDRLVFLVMPQEEKFGFEIRSLQEFMAAWALMSKSDAALLEQRLAQIAPSESFRNVFLFAASKCFTELSELRDAIVDRICPAQNEADDASKMTLPGSRLALEILEEGSALDQPKYARRLMVLAARLLELPPGPEHPRLARACEGHAEVPLQKALGERLSLPDVATRLPAWLTLITLIDSDVAWARELGDSRWPTDAEDERQIFSLVVSSTHRLGVWLQRKVAERPAAFPPSSLGPMWGVQRERSELVPAWIDAAFTIAGGWYGSDSHIEVNASSEDGTELFSLFLRSLNVADLDRWHAIATMPDPPPQWEPLVESARFLVTPTAPVLAAVLKSIRDRYDASEAGWVAGEVPWLLRACLLNALEPDDLGALSASVTAGELGNREDWFAAEEHWREHGIEVREILPVLGTRLPASRFHEVPRVRLPLSGARVAWGIFEDRNDPRAAEINVWFQGLIDAQRKAEGRERVLLARWILQQGSPWMQGGVDAGPLSPADIERLWNDAGVALNLDELYSVFDADTLEWTELLEKIGESGRFFVDHQSAWLIEPLFRVLGSDPFQRGLLRIAVSLAISVIDVREYRGGGLPEVPAAVSKAQTSDDLDLRADATLLLLAGGGAHLDDILSVVQRLSESSRAKERISDAAFLASETVEDPDLRERLLLALARATAPGDWDTLKYVIRGLSQSLRTRLSGLADSSVWDRLALPPPRPGPPRFGAVSGSIPPPSQRAGSFQIESIKLLGLRILDEITLPIRTPEDAASQWIVLLGDNGVGKTTILRGIVLALAEPAVTTSLLATMQSRLSRFGARSSESIVRTREGTFRTSIEIDSDLEITKEVPAEESAPRRPPIFAYGVRRGSSLGGSAREVKFSPILDVATLFDEAASLIHAETWLTGLALDAEQNPAKRPLFDTIARALTGVLPSVTAVRIRDKRVWVTRGGEEVPLAALSDGYLTTAGWLLDLIARWVDRAERRGETPGDGFTATMEGVVIVDEIDLLLHPRWQCTIIEDVRAIFPRMTFIVTTHNPLTLLGAREGEIFVLRRSRDLDGAEGSPKARQVDLPKGARADQILTGAWFGLPSTVDPETQELLEEHRHLLRKGNGASQARIEELEEILRDRLGSFADTSLERLAQSVAAQIMDERYRELTPEEREDIQREVKERVRAESAPSEDGG